MAKKKGDKNITPAKWQEMKQAYITENKSLRDIAKEFEVSDKAVFDKSTEDKWVVERTQYWANIQQELSSFLTEKMIDAKKNLVNTGIYLFGMGVKKYQALIDKIDKAQPDKEGNKPEFNMAEARTMMHDGIKILEMFMEEKGKLDVYFPQAEESEAAKAVMAFFDKLHGKHQSTNRLTDGSANGEGVNS